MQRNVSLTLEAHLLTQVPEHRTCSFVSTNIMSRHDVLRDMSCTCTYVKQEKGLRNTPVEEHLLVMFTWYIVESPLKLTRVLDLHLILQGRYFDQTQGGKHLNSWCHLTTYAQSIASDGWWESSAADRDLLKGFGIFAEAPHPCV